MRSVRLSDELDERVRRAAAAEQETVSEFLRKAAAERANAVIARDNAGKKNSEILADIIASVRGSGPQVSQRTGDAFAELLDEQDRRKRARRR